MNNTDITPQSSVQWVGVTTDNELKFDPRNIRLWESTGCQLTPLTTRIRLI